MTDALDTGAVEGTAPYFNRNPNPDLEDCKCKGVPDGHHVPSCKYCTTPDAQLCEHCKNRNVHTHGVCSICGYLKEKESE